MQWLDDEDAILAKVPLLDRQKIQVSQTLLLGSTYKTTSWKKLVFTAQRWRRVPRGKLLDVGAGLTTGLERYLECRWRVASRWKGDQRNRRACQGARGQDAFWPVSLRFAYSISAAPMITSVGTPVLTWQVGLVQSTSFCRRRQDVHRRRDCQRGKVLCGQNRTRCRSLDACSRGSERAMCFQGA